MVTGRRGRAGVGAVLGRRRWAVEDAAAVRRHPPLGAQGPGEEETDDEEPDEEGDPDRPRGQRAAAGGRPEDLAQPVPQPLEEALLLVVHRPAQLSWSSCRASGEVG